MTTVTALIEIRGLSKTYPGAPQPALAGVDLDVPEGEIFGLVGPNGAGKTTLLALLCGQLPPDSGTIRVFGHEVRHGNGAWQREIGIVPQDLALYPMLTARENLRFFGAMHGLRGARLRQRVDWCLEAAGLQEYAAQRVQTYSGGLKRRLNLVIGLIHEPRLLILDEPTVGIDPHSRRFIHEQLRRLNAAGLSIIYTSHYLDEVEQLCRQLAIMDRGRILAHGTLDEILNGVSDHAVELRFGAPVPAVLREALQRLPGVRAAHLDGRAATLISDAAPRTAAAALEAATRHEVPVTALRYGEARLEQVFLALTGTHLRDD